MPRSANRFTLAAREASIRARREAKAARERERANGVRPDRPEVFVVRPHARGFSFELRRFGGVVEHRSDCLWPTEAAAREAGEAHLAAAR